LKIQGSEVKRYLKNVSVRYIYGKMLILTFEDSEEEILNHIVSYISTGTKAFQVVENARTELRFDGLEIDVAKRLVRKQKQEIDLTFTEFEILHLLARNPGRVFVISVFYMADNNGLRTLPEKEYKKAVKFYVEFYSLPAYNI
jgi:hypothetical protein